jgi:hypothetical protein
MKASGKVGSNGVYVSDNVEKRFETDIHIYNLKLASMKQKEGGVKRSARVWICSESIQNTSMQNMADRTTEKTKSFCSA